MLATRSDKVIPRSAAISLSPVQNASSRLTLVLWLAITIERLTTGDFILHLLIRSDDHRDRDASWHPARLPVCARLCRARGDIAVLPQLGQRHRVRGSCAPCLD